MTTSYHDHASRVPLVRCSSHAELDRSNERLGRPGRRFQSWPGGRPTDRSTSLRSAKWTGTSFSNRSQYVQRLRCAEPPLDATDRSFCISNFWAITFPHMTTICTYKYYRRLLEATPAHTVLLETLREVIVLTTGQSGSVGVVYLVVRGSNISKPTQGFHRLMLLERLPSTAKLGGLYDRPSIKPDWWTGECKYRWGPKSASTSVPPPWRGLIFGVCPTKG